MRLTYADAFQRTTIYKGVFLNCQQAVRQCDGRQFYTSVKSIPVNVFETFRKRNLFKGRAAVKCFLANQNDTSREGNGLQLLATGDCPAPNITNRRRKGYRRQGRVLKRRTAHRRNGETVNRLGNPDSPSGSRRHGKNILMPCSRYNLNLTCTQFANEPAPPTRSTPPVSPNTTKCYA